MKCAFVVASALLKDFQFKIQNYNKYPSIKVTIIVVVSSIWNVTHTCRTRSQEHFAAFVHYETGRSTSQARFYCVTAQLGASSAANRKRISDTSKGEQRRNLTVHTLSLVI